MAKKFPSEMTDIDVFHDDEDRSNFESFARQNGFQYWLASDLAGMLGYSDLEATRRAINKAMAVCMTLNIPVGDNFQQTESDYDRNDYKLSRFACYLTVMNGDVRNVRVAAAQGYFVRLAETMQAYIQQADGVERLLVRGEVSEREKSLSSTARQHGVTNYAFFQNAGYRGLYNMNLARLREHKGLAPGGTLLDFMGKEELAANLFRITQTEAKIRREGLQGQQTLERTAENVGRDVRNTMIRISGTKPESLALQGNIADVKKGIKSTHKHMKKLDGPKNK